MPTPKTAAPGVLRVLVVDDDDDVRLALARAVDRLGHYCEAVADGEQALSLHGAHPFDVIIADWVMPHLDGLELCRRTRGTDEKSYTYFIFATGLDDKAHMLEGMRAGADDYLTKPIDVDQLEARLVSAQRVIGLHRRLSQKNRALRRDSQRLFQVARTDPLTEIDNRLRMQEDLEASCARHRRYGLRFCGAICDIDFFKRFNDRFGHLAGDDALRHVAHAIRSTLRGSDGVYRYGGEEFLVILAEQSLPEAAAAMERVRQAIGRLVLAPAGEAMEGLLTISIGIAELHGESSIEWLQRADAALYRAKELGRNRVEVAQDLRPA